MLLRLPGLPSLPKLRATHFCVYAEPWDTPKLWASLRGPALDLPQAVRRPTQRGPSSSPAALGPRQVSAPQEAQVWPWGCGPSSSRRGALGLQVRRAPGGRPKLFTLQTSGPPLQPRAYQERGEARTDPRAGAGILPSPPPFCSTPPSSFSLIFIYLKTLLKMKTVLPKGQHWEVVFKNPATNPVSNHPPQVSVSA